MDNIFTSKNITLIEGNKYNVKTIHGDINIEIPLDLRTNLIGLKAIDETDNSFESYIIRTSVEYLKLSKETKKNNWDDFD